MTTLNETYLAMYKYGSITNGEALKLVGTLKASNRLNEGDLSLFRSEWENGVERNGRTTRYKRYFLTDKGRKYVEENLLGVTEKC